MELASKYNPADVEGKWYQYWLDNKLFSSKPDGREPYTIVIPPPNVTGVLHMGHMLNNTIQDILVRRARMEGKNACWVPGTDHASIATEAKVVNKLAQQGIKKTAKSSRYGARKVSTCSSVAPLFFLASAPARAVQARLKAILLSAGTSMSPLHLNSSATIYKGVGVHGI